MKTAITIFWVVIWATPAIIAIASDSILLVLIAMLWVLLLKLLTDAYAPEWMIEILNKFSRG